MSDKGIPAPPSAPSAIGAATGERRGAILGAIFEHPDSDEARQVYADQLIANNDPRGEFILLDIALAGPLSIRKRGELAARRTQLLKDHAAAWWPYSVAHSRVHKGFLQAVHGSWRQIDAIAAQLFAAEPVTELGLTSAGDQDLAALLQAPWLPRIQRLILRGLNGDAAFTTLTASRKLENLRALNVSANDLGAEALAALDDTLPRLENLCLTGNPIGDDGVAALGRWKQLAHLDTLYLSTCELSDVDPLFAGPPLAKLSKLALSNNDLGDVGAGTLVKRAAWMPALEHLELTNCGISSSGARALAAATMPKLKRLDLRRNGFDEAVDPRIRV